MFPVTITIHNAADLGKVMAALDAAAPTQPIAADIKAALNAVTSPAPSPADQSAVKYDDLKAAVFKLAGKSRDAAIAINKQFGVATMKELAADRWAEALAAVNAKLVELGA